MREIGTGDDERVGVADQLGERNAERAAGLVALIAHDDGNQFELAKRSLQEWELDFQGMFGLLARAFVPAARQMDRTALSCQFRSESLVHGDFAQRRDVGVAVIHRGEGKGVVVRRSDDHHALKLAVLERGVTEGRHASGIWISGVGSDQRNQRVIGGRHLRLGEEPIHHVLQFVGIGGIEPSGHASLPRFSLRAC